MSERDIHLVNQGLHLGVVIDEHQADFGRGDFLVRNVLGADQANGAIAIGDEVEVGTTVQFHVRDAESADEDLRMLLAVQEPTARCCSPATAGDRLFGTPTMTPRWWAICSPTRPSPASSPPASSGRSVAATSCTPSPRRWRCSPNRPTRAASARLPP